MRIESALRRQIRKVFGFQEDLERAAAAEVPGYPALARRSFFLSALALDHWEREETIRFPDECCVCGAPAANHLPSREPSGFLGRWKRTSTNLRVPHCSEHGREKEARLLIQTTPWGPGALLVTLLGLNPRFIEKTASLNSEGDPVPPWRAFPGYGPESGGWRQGNGEVWMNEVWSPFWSALPKREREEFLARWQASSEWRDRVVI
jgi:hypothetical protein